MKKLIVVILTALSVMSFSSITHAQRADPNKCSVLAEACKNHGGTTCTLYDQRCS